jgi:GT2 family glycosyltransferase/glycosyltransferase involved in cell wall biosynthesis
LTERIQIAFASGSEDLIPTLIEQMRALRPELPLYVVSEFPVKDGIWVPYRIGRSLREQLARYRAYFTGKQVILAGLIVQPRMPYWTMRFVPLLLWPLQAVVFNENLDHFMFRPRSAPVILRHLLWRAKNFLRWHLKPGGGFYTFCWRLAHPWAFLRPLLYVLGRAAGWLASAVKAAVPPGAEPALGEPFPAGISIVVPSRNGRELLARLMPSLHPQLSPGSEVIVVDNGSGDGTLEYLSTEWPGVVCEESRRPLSFAVAANRGIRRARFSHICLLNNDMVVEKGFLTELRKAFDEVPELFAATAQIVFPEGVRREETGKAVMPPREWRKKGDFPVRCDLPVEGEDFSYVLYGSGGCTLYDARKLHALGLLDEAYQPAYVEDLDLGYRAWLCGWPTVYVAAAKVLHLHRSTTSRYYRESELEQVLERNYLRFLASATASSKVFRGLWKDALARLNLRAAEQDAPLERVKPLARSLLAPVHASRRAAASWDENLILPLTSGAVAVFPGARPSKKPRILVASPYLPFPLSHGGAVRMYNLMRRAAGDFDQVLVSFVDAHEAPPRELLEICVEVVEVRRVGTHILPASKRPDVVEEFASPGFSAALRQTVRKWRPQVAQLEFTQLAQFEADCAPAKTILVEHDVTLDLYAQFLRDREDWDLRRQYERWVEFETAAWRRVDAVVVMSEKDRESVRAGRCEVIRNGVDLERFQPASVQPEQGRLLFIGSFAHLPNVMAVRFFLDEVWQELRDWNPVLHIIAGSRHRYYLDHYRDRVAVNLEQPGLVVEDFVSDVRPAYQRAAIVIAPLVASAGTNIKIMEAMAMGKAVVSTPAGINGLALEPGRDVLVAQGGKEMAGVIRQLLANPQRRMALESQARLTVEREHGWDAIALRQKSLYESL